MLPLHEIDTLILTVAEAHDLARAGKAAEGYPSLLSGLQRAKEIEAAGEVWGQELVRRWQQACDNYADEYGVGRA